MRAFGGSANAGQGIRSIVRRLSREASTATSRPRARSAPAVASAALSSAASSSGVARRRATSSGPRGPSVDASEPRFVSKRTSPASARRRSRNCRSMLSALVPVTMTRCTPRRSSSRSNRRRRRASASCDGTAVPSQSNTIASKRRERPDPCSSCSTRPGSRRCRVRRCVSEACSTLRVSHERGGAAREPIRRVPGCAAQHVLGLGGLSGRALGPSRSPRQHRARASGCRGGTGRAAALVQQTGGRVPRRLRHRRPRPPARRGR